MIGSTSWSTRRSSVRKATIETSRAASRSRGYAAYVTRREKVWVVAQDRRGRKIKIAGSGLLGRAFQHELDHLDGKLYIDYLDSMDELIPVGRGDDEEGVAAEGENGEESAPKARTGGKSRVKTPALA